MKTGSVRFDFAAIATVRTPFPGKYGVPRQPGLAEEARGVIQFNNDPDLLTALKSFDEFSHLWIVFVFHQHGGKNWKPSIRPPRLGGKRKVGVLASRSPHRPNPIGISAVKIDKIILDAPEGPQIHVSGVDLIDGTPVLDIKPYIAYADSIPDANAGWASDPIPTYEVRFTTEAEQQIHQLPEPENFKRLAKAIIELDPRPAYQKTKFPVQDPAHQGLEFGIDVHDYDVRFRLEDQTFTIYKLIRLNK